MTKHSSLYNGKFLACPESPNCVSSQADPEDERHYLAAFVFKDSAEDAFLKLVTLLKSMPRSKIVVKENLYLHVEFRSRIMGFVDDVEFYVDPEKKCIEFRSAARSGYADFGVNRKRLKEIARKLSFK